jgi:hypothetical protein
MFLSIDTIRPIFQPYVDKLLGHVHHVLAAPSQINTAVTFNVATKSPSATAVPKKTKDQKKDNTPSLFHTSYILTSLHVISNLLLLLRSSLPLEPLEENTWNLSQYPQTTKTNSSDYPLDLILLQNPFRRESLSGSRSTPVSLESQAARLELLKSIESTICSYWNLSTNNQSLISTSASTETYQMLLSLALVSMPLSAIFLYYLNSTSVSFNDRPSLMSHHFHLYQDLFKSFPYQSEEGMIAPSGSTLESESKRRVETLNMILCESSFIASLRYFSFQIVLNQELRSTSLKEMLSIINLSSAYLASSVEIFSQKLQRQLDFQQKLTLSVLEFDFAVAVHDERSQEITGADDLNKRGGSGGNGTLSESVLRLFRCLSYQSQYLINCKHNVSDFTKQLTSLLNQFSSLLNQFLFLLHSSHTSTMSPQTSVGVSPSRSKKQRMAMNSKEISQLLFSIEKILLCSWKMIRQDDIWDFGGNISDGFHVAFLEARNLSLFGLLEKICKIPQVLSSWMRSQPLTTGGGTSGDRDDGNQEEIVHSILRQVCDILHVIVTRGGKESGGEREEGDAFEDISMKRWKQQLNQMVCQTIAELFQPEDPSSATSSPTPITSSCLSFYLSCHQSYRQNWLDIWFYCDFQSMRNEVLMNLLELLCSPEIITSGQGEEQEEDQSHFFSLLYLKRYEFTPSDLVTIVMNSFDCHINTLMISSPVTLFSFQRWCQLVADLFYLAPPSSNSLSSIVNLFFPQLKALLPLSLDLNLRGQHVDPASLLSLPPNFPITYFQCYLTSSLFSSIFRRYKNSNSMSLALPPPVISFSPSHFPADHQQSLEDFLNFFIDSLARYLMDNSSSSRTLLQSGWEHLKHHHTDLLNSSSSSFRLSNEWILDLLQTQWNLPSTPLVNGEGESCPISREQQQLMDVWEELLKNLSLEVISWREALKSSRKEESPDAMEEVQSQDIVMSTRCLYLLSNLFEIVQHLKTMEKLTVERTKRLTDFLAVVQSHFNLTSQIDEFVSDMVRYVS